MGSMGWKVDYLVCGHFSCSALCADQIQRALLPCHYLPVKQVQQLFTITMVKEMQMKHSIVYKL